MTKRERELIESCAKMLDATFGHMSPSEADAVVKSVTTMLRILIQ